MSILNKHLLDNTDRATMEVFFKDLKALPCGRYEIYTCSIAPTRSPGQRKYYFKVICGRISEFWGYSKDQVNEILKFRFNKKEVELPDGSWVKHGASIEREKVKRVEEIYAEIRQWAAESMALDLPEPNEVSNEEYVLSDNEY